MITKEEYYGVPEFDNQYEMNFIVDYECHEMPETLIELEFSTEIEYPQISLTEFETMVWPDAMAAPSTMVELFNREKLLEKEVALVQEQLYNAYKRIDLLKKEIDLLKQGNALHNNTRKF